MTSGLFGVFSFGYLLSCFFFFHTFKHDIWDYIFALKKKQKKTPRQHFKYITRCQRDLKRKKILFTVHTYSNSSVHHHGTDSEHQERDGKSNTGIFCMRKRQKEYTEWIQLKILLQHWLYC